MSDGRHNVDVGDDIGDPTLEKVLRFLAGWGVPALVTGAWLFLALTSDASLIGKVLMGVGLAIVLALWQAIRGMTLHAALARAIAVGNARRAIELADDQLRRRRSAKARAPFFVYIALAHELHGEWSDVIAVLDRAHADARGVAPPPSMALLAASARIAALVETGDAVGARAIFDRDVAPIARTLTPDQQTLVELARARVQWAEGDVGGAREAFDRVALQIRAAGNTRAIGYRYAARAAAAAGDTELAARYAALAVQLAPETWAATTD